MTNFLSDALAGAHSLVRSEVFQAVVVDVTGYRATVRRPNSTAREGPYICLGAPPPVGSIVTVTQVGRTFLILTHHGHQAFAGPTIIVADYAASPQDVFILADPTAGDITITLASLYPPGAEVTVKRELDGTANSVFIANASGQIESLASIELAAEGNSVILRKGTTNWYIAAGFP